MKILFFVHVFPCVSETFVLNQVTSLIDKGHDVRVYAWGKSDSCIHEDFIKYNLNDLTWHLSQQIPQNKTSRLNRAIKILNKGFKLHKFKIFKLLSPAYGKIAKNLVLTYCAERLLDEKQWIPDVVISHFGDNGIFVNAFKAAGILPEKTVSFTFFHAHEICRMSVAEIGKFYKSLFSGDDILLPISNFWKDKLIAAGAEEKNVKVFHMGVNSERFKFHSDFSINNQTLNILTVGRLVGQKGYEYSIKGVTDFIKKSNLRVNYTIIGQGELENKLKSMVQELGISDYVHFLGAQTQAVVTEYMKDSEIFLLPSVTDSDGFMEGIPVALMEAMACGKICISTFHSGIPELISNGVNGFLCPERDSDAIASTLNNIVHMTTEKLNKISQNARLKVENNFDICKLMEDLDQLIKDPTINSRK